MNPNRFSYKTLFPLFLLLLFVGISNTQAQRRDYNNISYFSIYYSPYVGDFYYTGGYNFLTRYDGDLGSFTGESKVEQSSKILSLRNINLGIGYQLTHWTSVRFDIHRFKFDVKEDYVTKTAVEPRYQGFSSGSNWDISINLIHDLTAKGTIDAGQKKYSPYFITGIGLVQQKGELNSDGIDSERYFETLRDEKVKKWAVNMPLGMGFKYYLKHNVHVALEARGAFVLSDKLDHVGKERGNSAYKDFYMFIGGKVTWQKSYKFNYQYYRKKHYHIDKSKKSKEGKEKKSSQKEDSSGE
ncbi:MAG: hypothetical protein ACI85I_000987 [Arenicella sp.]|jgi:hypothetical protein